MKCYVCAQCGAPVGVGGHIDHRAHCPRFVAPTPAYPPEVLALVRAARTLLDDAIAAKLNEAARWGYALTYPELCKQFPKVVAHIQEAAATLKPFEGVK